MTIVRGGSVQCSHVEDESIAWLQGERCNVLLGDLWHDRKAIERRCVCCLQTSKRQAANLWARALSRRQYLVVLSCCKVPRDAHAALVRPWQQLQTRRSARRAVVSIRACKHVIGLTHRLDPTAARLNTPRSHVHEHYHQGQGQAKVKLQLT